MTREQSWQVEGVTHSLLRQIESLDYTVSVHRIASSLLGRVGAFVEMHAVDLRTDPPVQKLARIGLDEAMRSTAVRACWPKRSAFTWTTGESPPSLVAEPLQHVAQRGCRRMSLLCG